MESETYDSSSIKLSQNWCGYHSLLTFYLQGTMPALEYLYQYYTEMYLISYTCKYMVISEQ
jgi:hypothetical protein